MHELGIVFYILRDVKEEAEKNNVKKINKVVLELGEVSGVVPSYLLDCWKWAREKEEMFKGSELVLEFIKAVSFCEDCKIEFNTLEHAKKCPKCNHENTYLLKGNEVFIKEIEVLD